MKLPVLASLSIALTATLLSSCAGQTSVSSETSVPMSTTSAPASPSDVVPTLTATASTLECSTYAPDAVSVIRQEADVMASDVQYRIATVACGAIAGEVSAEVVEAFVLENGAWASVGLVSGPDVPFNTTQACETDNTTVTCPAYSLGEEGEAAGNIEVTAQDNGLVWTFITQ